MLNFGTSTAAKNKKEEIEDEKRIRECRRQSEKIICELALLNVPTPLSYGFRQIKCDPWLLCVIERSASSFHFSSFAGGRENCNGLSN